MTIYKLTFIARDCEFPLWVMLIADVAANTGQQALELALEALNSKAIGCWSNIQVETIHATEDAPEYTEPQVLQINIDGSQSD